MSAFCNLKGSLSPPGNDLYGVKCHVVKLSEIKMSNSDSVIFNQFSMMAGRTSSKKPLTNGHRNGENKRFILFTARGGSRGVTVSYC